MIAGSSAQVLSINDPVEKILAARLKLCYVEGKKKKDNSNSLVPILFTSETVEAIDSLVQHRSEVGIADTNEYCQRRGREISSWLEHSSGHFKTNSFEKTNSSLPLVPESVWQP